MNTTDFQPGMTIYSADDISLGQVQEIWAQTDSHGTLPVSQYLLQDFGPVHGTADLLTSPDGYLHVQQGNWLSGERHDLYIPLAAVQSIHSPASASVTSPAHVCQRRYAALPRPVRRAA